MKERKEEKVKLESLALNCEMTGCGFVVLGKARLVILVGRQHERVPRLKEKCLFCEGSICKQALPMHKRFHQANPKGGRSS